MSVDPLNGTSLLCYQCGKLYESVFEYDEDENLEPILGTCLHSICILCFTALNSKDCPICGKKDAFEDMVVNNSALENLRIVRTHFMEQNNAEIFEKIKSIKEGFCSGCEQQNQMLHFCKDCVESDENGFKLLNKRDEDWIFLPSPKLIKLFCKKCFENDENHESHALISIKNVLNMEEAVSIEAILSVLTFRKSFYQEVVDYFDKGNGIKELDEKNEALKKEPHCCHVFKEKLRFDIRDGDSKIIKLEKRKILFYKEHLMTFLTFYEDQKNNVEQEEKYRIQNALDQLYCILKTFEKIPENWLTLEELDKIDTEIERRMKQLEDDYKKESFIKIEEINGYFKYHALIKELKSAHEELMAADEIIETMSNEVRQYEIGQQFGLSQFNVAKERSDLEPGTSTEADIGDDHINIFRKILEMDEAAEKFKLDMQRVERNKIYYRTQFTEVMIMKYFPKSVDGRVLNFLNLINEFKFENNIK
ncbi:hypothetical protein CAEBREN_32126 [Caenorhabditis brenneri]|uniref:RING-type domain-containing protein n=1 Tax=Caenorhabditis brenneri TaxID=135651 RepID=G0P8B5_CAEBE|nr:hypothetical protein CAEBREN_32126 [Caenorhabditis brenneri]